MTPIPWSTLEPGQTEQVIGVLLCRRHPTALRVRVSQGDGGIDVMVPADEGQADIYQVKLFATPLNDSRKQQIRDSLRRIIDNPDITVRSWFLTLPLNPSNAERTWFETVTRQAPFPCFWFGLDQVESLAAAHPDVIDYYLHDGRDRLESSIASLRSLAGLMRPAGNQLVEPSDLTEPLGDLYDVLNRDDPHYRYEFEVGLPPPLEADLLRPHLIARVSAGGGERTVTHRVYSRYRMAAEDSPIPLSFQVDEEDLDAEAFEAWQRALRYGTEAEIIARNVASGLPGGLGDTFEVAGIHIGAASRPGAQPYRIRLGALDPEGRLLASIIRPTTEPAVRASA